MPRHPLRRIAVSIALALAAVFNPLADRDVLPPPTVTVLDAPPLASEALSGQIQGARQAAQVRGGDQGLGPDFPLGAQLTLPPAAPAGNQVVGLEGSSILEGLTITTSDGTRVTFTPNPQPGRSTIELVQEPHRLGDTLERLDGALDRATSLASASADLLEDKQPPAPQRAEHADGRPASE
jgi:hypothetical protein